jgi:hypothetical protein
MRQLIIDKPAQFVQSLNGTTIRTIDKQFPKFHDLFCNR